MQKELNNSLLGKINQLREGKVLIVGDIMLDKYLHGDAERISPEAPVPVVLVENEKKLLGGAGNVARNIVALGGFSKVFGLRGKDLDGESLEKLLNDLKIPANLIVSGNRPTTVKLRILARKQQMIRIDWEDISPVAKNIQQELLKTLKEDVKKAGAIIISDYNKGLVSAELLKKISHLIKGSGRNIPILVDPKPKNKDLYRSVTLLTPNTKETEQMSGILIKGKADIISAGLKIMKDLSCPQLVITLGAAGMAVFSSQEEIWHIKTAAKEVFDVTGAGDTVIGVIGLGLAAGLSLIEAALIANYSAGIVVGQVGAATACLRSLEAAIREVEPNGLSRWL